ncbi:MAG TPA: type II secretion system protein GspJ [Anaerohalosphaeraceae bacterium]|nr:prepilin-type N-terminal cleavage/methylation domain-containing protein [Phycisphaerae bacterium]HOK94887.1 type II secretion system protein GspJ [Anaerohalosphaeraceae bacterium]HOL31534.1 type II secretion system protein GspJ [Anaerohalosphaeraceae bacterium]HOM75658.1 type II secretion system protein GspJ [Anaerohalosphaeraceae bacterium]HPC64426.1 type II secretion system protein GspJ [Anaerohalosphaeraceae bacterium]
MSKQAFTLLELIVAIALMDVIAVSLYASMHIGFTAKKNTQAAMIPFRSVLPVFETIRNDLICAMPPTGILAGTFLGEDANNAAQKDADVLSFYTDSYQPATDEIACNIIYVQYGLEEDPQRGGIVLKRKTIKNLLSTKTIIPDTEIIGRNIYGFDVKYYDGYTWLDTWTSSTQNNTLPRGVRITLDLSPESRRSGQSPDQTRGTLFTRTFMLSSSSLAAEQEAASSSSSARQ